MKSKLKEVINLAIKMIGIASISAVFGYGYFWLLCLVTSYTALQCVILSIFMGCMFSSMGYMFSSDVTITLNNGLIK